MAYETRMTCPLGRQCGADVGYKNLWADMISFTPEIFPREDDTLGIMPLQICASALCKNLSAGEYSITDV